MTLAFQGCVSVQVSRRNGKPKLIGFGSAKLIAGTSGQIYQIVAPGLCVRLHSYAPGLSLGWHETRLFYPAIDRTASPAEPVAVQRKCFGLDFTPSEVMVGFDRSFLIPLPTSQTNVIQVIIYDENKPADTLVQQKVIHD